jgi:aerotolerance regulator-like protein
MPVAWLMPAALAGIALIALPIAVHLMVRQPVRRVPFPSLRFLRETQLAALRRRSIQDGWLLLCRAAIVALAAVALAGPVFMTAARTTSFAARTSRAIVTIDAIDEATIEQLTAGAFATATFNRGRVSDALADAVRWLNAQPPSAREIVIAGPLRRGAVGDGDLAGVPAEIGLRFHPIAFTGATETVFSVLARRDGRLVKLDRDVAFSADATRVVDRGQSAVDDDLVTIHARVEDRDLATAALRAALDAGVPWSDFTTRVAIVWEGGDRPAQVETRVIDMAVPKPLSSAADRVHAALSELTTSVLAEPLAITPAQLAAWTRSPGPPSPDAPLSDEGDRRWIWAAVLLLMAIETWLRSPRQRAATRPDEEARVA